MSKMKIKLPAAVFALIALSMSCFLYGCSANKPADDETVLTENTVPQAQEETVGTEPSVTEEVVPVPWDETGAKQPADYTWEEYEGLTGSQQQAFREYLGTEAFELWLNRMRGQAEVKPWDEPGAKQPADYSWEEFEALSAAQQIAFQRYLGLEAFSEWLTRVQSQMEDLPWDGPGAKQPVDYTWEEFEALTGAQQMIFQYTLGVEGFKNWLDAVEHQSDEVFPWEKSGAKQPADYTWAEFEALTPAQQMAFQNALGAEEFEKWIDNAQSQRADNPWEKPGAKQPLDYTWAEFEALTPAQQIAFQNVLGAEAFEEWIDNAQSQREENPWEKPGAKQPADYTWAEFEALTGSQQMAFQIALGPDAFDAWLQQNAG